MSYSRKRRVMYKLMHIRDDLWHEYFDHSVYRLLAMELYTWDEHMLR